LINNYKPKTVNIRLNAINFYLNKINKSNLKVQLVKIQQKPFLENVISQADYEYLKNKLKKDNQK
jgi:possible integrase/recombinase